MTRTTNAQAAVSPGSAPPPSASLRLIPVSLDDKYTLNQGRIFITGTQALVRLPMTQHVRDQKHGLNTAGYVSGYRGSPLGALDEQLHRAKKHLETHQVLFVPGVNEDLAATAVWGTQQVQPKYEGAYDGVFAMWYGKGPGVDRSGDALRHGNLAGSSPHGGVLVLMGDDHTCESSTTCHQSEFAMMDAMIPVLSPASVQEILDYGVLGWALSRYSGCWVGLKCVKDTVEASASIDVDIDRVQIQLPQDVTLPPDGLNLRLEDTPHLQETRLHQHKLRAALAFAQCNQLDRVVRDAPAPLLGIITHGKSYLDVLQALDELDLSPESTAQLGVRLYKVGMVWPLEPQGAQTFAAGLKKVLVVEEKRNLLEFQLKEHLYGSANAPVIVGKRDESGQTLFQSEMALDSVQIAIAIGERLLELHAGHTADELSALLTALQQKLVQVRAYRSPKKVVALLDRSVYFCSGCPHNSSTIVPEGSTAYAGIGCSWMAYTMGRSTIAYTQMGAEGMTWVGEAPFSKRKHIFQNLGDGTYFHSGLLAIRAAVAAKTNITFKILYNDAVAMTGGQKHDGPLDPIIIAHQVHAEGVKRIAIVTDEPQKYPATTVWPSGVKVYHRDELNAVQRELRDIEGTTALIYDQTCAAEKRRRRKRNAFPDPAKRLVINDLVCEGCGDCGVQSNCVSVQPLETEWGRKRQIDQSACNKDYSCLKGFCPSFVSVLGGKLRKPDRIQRAAVFPALPEPVIPSVENGVYSILVAGMGGTGVVTIGGILGMAAHLQGLGCGVLDMAGLAQKGGSVWSHMRFGKNPEAVKTIRIASGGADLVLGCDFIVTGSEKTLQLTRAGKTRMVVNTQENMPGHFARDINMQFPGRGLRRNIENAVGADNAEFVQASRIAVALMGDSIAANMFMLGFAWQRGLIPVSAQAIEQAIEINGVAQQMNRDAFLWGRRMAVDAPAVEKLCVPAETRDIAGVSPAPVQDLQQAITLRRAFLVDYQNEALAQRYTTLVDKVRFAEKRHFPGRSDLSWAVAKSYFKLLAIKDEYEVARLHVETSFLRNVQQQFEGDTKLVFHLAPPLLFARRNPETGAPLKREFGAWIIPVFKVLARLRGLRGTAFDVFGRTKERRAERALIYTFETHVDQILNVLQTSDDPAHYTAAVALAGLPQEIRGYGHVRERNMQAAQVRATELLAALHAEGSVYKQAA